MKFLLYDNMFYAVNNTFGVSVDYDNRKIFIILPNVKRNGYSFSLEDFSIKEIDELLSEITVTLRSFVNSDKCFVLNLEAVIFELIAVSRKQRKKG